MHVCRERHIALTQNATCHTIVDSKLLESDKRLDKWWIYAFWVNSQRALCDQCAFRTMCLFHMNLEVANAMLCNQYLCDDHCCEYMVMFAVIKNMYHFNSGHLDFILSFFLSPFSLYVLMAIDTFLCNATSLPLFKMPSNPKAVAQLSSAQFSSSRPTIVHSKMQTVCFHCDHRLPQWHKNSMKTTIKLNGEKDNETKKNMKMCDIDGPRDMCAAHFLFSLYFPRSICSYFLCFTIRPVVSLT